MILGTRSGEGGDGDGQTYRASLSPASVKVSLVFCEVDLVESGMSPSLALVWKSLRPKSDMMTVVWWCFLEGWKVVVGRLQKLVCFVVDGKYILEGGRCLSTAHEHLARHSDVTVSFRIHHDQHPQLTNDHLFLNGCA
jgi:hypothetical protein